MCHETDTAHDHYGQDVAELQRSHPLWRTDRIVLKSVGIDIGTSTSHLIFSTLEMRRQSAVLSSRFELAERKITYASPILLTPFVRGLSLDLPVLQAFFKSSYQEAGVVPAGIDTGAVITTGEAARKDNAAAVVSAFSEQSGKFVCASAGPMLEAKMAAYGSGAVARSADELNPVTVLNIDVGGGTTKFGLVQDGKILETAAVNVGARLIVFGEDGIVTKIEKGAAVVARHENLFLQIGCPVSAETLISLARALAGVVVDVAARNGLSALAKDLMISAPLSAKDGVDVVMFSGGVSEYFYGVNEEAFGDIGPLLAEELRAEVASRLGGVQVERPAQGIRATVIGASQFTAQVSGNTIHIGNPARLPLKNLQVVAVDLEQEGLRAENIAHAVKASLAKNEAAAAKTPVALTFKWPHGPAYSQLNELCSGIAAGLEPAVANNLPITLVVDTDIARLIGSNLSAKLQGYTDILCIDGVELQDLDYIDISEEHPESEVVTVVIKSLVFTG